MFETPSRKYKGGREEWGRNTFPVENKVPCGACFSKRNYSQLSYLKHTWAGQAGRNYTLKARKHLGMICSFSLLLQRMIKYGWLWGHLMVRGLWLCNTQTKTYLNHFNNISSSGGLLPHTLPFCNPLSYQFFPKVLVGSRVGILQAGFCLQFPA